MVFCQRQGLFYCCCNFCKINSGFFSLASIQVKVVDIINMGTAYNYYFQLQTTESNSSVKGSVLPHVIEDREGTCLGNNETRHIRICRQGSLVSFLCVLLTYTYSASWSRVHHVQVHPSGKGAFLIIYMSNLITELSGFHDFWGMYRFSGQIAEDRRKGSHGWPSLGQAHVIIPLRFRMG